MGALKSRLLGHELPGGSNGNEFRVQYMDKDCQFSLNTGILRLTGVNLIFETTDHKEYVWPLNSLRRFGSDGDIFSFESGRRCRTGQGFHFFRCKYARQLQERLMEQISELCDNRHNEEMENPISHLRYHGLPNLLSLSTNRFNGDYVNRGNNAAVHGNASQSALPPLNGTMIPNGLSSFGDDPWATTPVSEATAYTQENGYVFPEDHGYVNDAAVVGGANVPIAPSHVHNASDAATYVNIAADNPSLVSTVDDGRMARCSSSSVNGQHVDTNAASGCGEYLNSNNVMTSNTYCTDAIDVGVPPVNYIQLEFNESPADVFEEDSTRFFENNNVSSIAFTASDTMEPFVNVLLSPVGANTISTSVDPSVNLTYTQIDFPRTDAMQRLRNERHRGRLQSSQGSSLGSLM